MGVVLGEGGRLEEAVAARELDRLSARVVVTGAAGYIGSVVTELLCDAGHDVAAWDNLGNGHRAAVDPRARFTRLDLLDREAVRGAMRAERPAAVVHLAAEALVDVSMRDPGRFYRANLVGGLNLLDAMVEVGSTRLVFSSTAATYGQPERSPITEEMAGNPCNSYGESKWAFERALYWYEAAHGLRHLSFRYFNACGATRAHGEDHRPETHIIPLLLATAQGCRDVFRLFGTERATPDGTCVRDYVHVVDIAAAHVQALGHVDAVPSGAFNLGLGRGYSNREVIATVEKVTGRRVPVEPAPPRPGDPDTLVADPAESRRVLGWEPRFRDLESMVATAWAWRQEHPEGYTA
jgi:UDP-glucose 4-epimerase